MMSSDESLRMHSFPLGAGLRLLHNTKAMLSGQQVGAERQGSTPAPELSGWDE